MACLNNHSLFYDSRFWEETWKKEYINSLYGRERENIDTNKYWNRRAGHFACLGKSQEGKQRVNAVLDRLVRYFPMEDNMEILDIGSGTGNFAIPLAKRSARVVALDPAEEMLKVLNERAEKEGLQNIETLCTTWEKIDLETKKWREKFDLVIAIMSPGINDTATLKKMISASKNACFIAGHLRQDISGRKELWRRLLGSEMPSIPESVLFIFHILYSWGYKPSLELEHRVTEKKLKPEQAIDEMETFFYPYIELTSEVRKVIAAYISEHLRDGYYFSRRDMTAGYLFWRTRLD